MNKKWLETLDITEVVTILALVIIAVFGMEFLKARAQELVVVIASGLVGYLARGNR